MQYYKIYVFLLFLACVCGCGQAKSDGQKVDIPQGRSSSEESSARPSSDTADITTTPKWKGIVVPTEEITAQGYDRLGSGNGIMLNPLEDSVEISWAFQYLKKGQKGFCLLYTSPSPRDLSTSRMPSSA